MLLATTRPWSGGTFHDRTRATRGSFGSPEEIPSSWRATSSDASSQPAVHEESIAGGSSVAARTIAEQKSKTFTSYRWVTLWAGSSLNGFSRTTTYGSGRL